MKAALCYFANLGFSGCEMRADGYYDYAHAIPAQRLKQAGIEKWRDPRVLFLACRAHHHSFDMKQLRLEEAQYPDHVRNYAKEIGFAFVDSRTGWAKHEED